MDMSKLHSPVKKVALLVIILLLASCSRTVIFTVLNDTSKDIVVTIRGFDATDDYPEIKSRKFILQDSDKSPYHAIANARGPYTFTIATENCAYAYDAPVWSSMTIAAIEEKYNIEFDLPGKLIIKVENDFSLHLFAKQMRKKTEDSTELFEWGFPMQPQVTCSDNDSG